jgi:hypothetical protein
MLTQPLSKAVSLAIGQQVDHCIAFQIDQNGSISAATAPGPVIDLSSDIRNPAVGDIENPATSVMLMSRSKPLRL